jgi:ADP-ribosylglycohydrolase
MRRVSLNLPGWGYYTEPGGVMIEGYEEQVYAGVLGKVIGVYMGRPFEGWPKERIQQRWGSIRGYVHEDRGVPLVVADDDLSGTFTFVRLLDDTGSYAATQIGRAHV